MLDLKQKQILDKFRALNPIKLEAENIAFGTKTEILGVKEGEVYKLPGSKTWIIFGELYRTNAFDDLKAVLERHLKNSKSENNEIENIKSSEIERLKNSEIEDIKSSEIPTIEVENQTVENTEFNKSDIDLLVEQTKCSEEEAKKALKKHSNDVVSALIELTNK